MREFELKDNITISLTSIQWVEDEKSETELITKAPLHGIYRPDICYVSRRSMEL